MGRMLRIGLAEAEIEAVDLGIISAGKILLYVTGTSEIRVGYTRTDVSSTSVQGYFTLLGGSQYLFDVGPNIGFLSQNQQLFFVSPSGDNTLEVWVADTA